MVRRIRIKSKMRGGSRQISRGGSGSSGRSSGSSGRSSGSSGRSSESRKRSSGSRKRSSGSKPIKNMTQKQINAAILQAKQLSTPPTDAEIAASFKRKHEKTAILNQRRKEKLKEKENGINSTRQIYTITSMKPKKGKDITIRNKIFSTINNQ